MSRISVMPSGVSVAGLGRRIVAALLDTLPVAVVGVAAGLLMASRQPANVMIVIGVVATVLALAWGLFVWWGYATRGAGPGARAMGIQVLGLTDGRPVGWGRIFLRELVWAASATFVIPWIVLVVMMITHQRRQGWHDLAAKCVVVRKARSLESGGSVNRSSVQSANTVGLPQHLAGSSFAGPSIPSAGELPSSIGYTPTAIGSGGFAGPIAAVPSSFSPVAEPAPQFHPAPSYEPAVQPRPQPSAPPAPPQPAVPWSQWGAAPPASAPVSAPPPQPAMPYQGQPQQGYAPQPVPTYPPQSVPPQPQQGYAPQPVPTYPPQSVPPQPQQGYAPQPGLAPQPVPGPADDYEGTHLASRSTGPAQRGAQDGWQARLDDGRLVDLDGLVLIGRNPVARPDETASQLVSAGAESRMVSKTHLALGTDARGPYVSDRGSTNGTAIAGANGEFEPCAPGDKVRLREGQIVSFGDRYLEIRRTH